MSAIDAALDLGYRRHRRSCCCRHASPAQRLLAACAKADRAAAEAVVAAHPGVVAGLTRGSDAADRGQGPCERHRGRGADARPRVRSATRPAPSMSEPIRWAAFLGNADMVRLLLRHNPPIGVRDPNYHGTLLGWCLHGSLHGWRARDRRLRHDRAPAPRGRRTSRSGVSADRPRRCGRGAAGAHRGVANVADTRGSRSQEIRSQEGQRSEDQDVGEDLSLSTLLTS